MNGGSDSEFVVHNRTRCQAGRALVDGSNRKQGAPCPNHVEPGSIFCSAHREAAWARVALAKRA